jgi:hypothetical protein
VRCVILPDYHLTYIESSKNLPSFRRKIIPCAINNVSLEKMSNMFLIGEPQERSPQGIHITEKFIGYFIAISIT